MRFEKHYQNLKALRIFRNLGFRLDASTTILDFGCGTGSKVQTLRQNGIRAFGADIKFKKKGDVATKEMQDCGFLRRIEIDNYILPFDDDYFDLLYSDQVFEHVKDYDRTLAEIARILKPDGCSVHIFPSRYKLIESHVYVPLASVLRSGWWLRLWAMLGIRNKFQSGLSARDVAANNRVYLESRTNYLPKDAIRRHFEAHFDEVSFREDLYLKHVKRKRTLAKLFELLPFSPEVISAIKCRVVVAQRPR